MNGGSTHTATVSGNVVTLTEVSADGVVTTFSSTLANVTATFAVTTASVATDTAIVAGDVTTTLNGVAIATTLVADESENSIATKIAASIDGNALYSATASGAVVSITAAVAEDQTDIAFADTDTTGTVATTSVTTQGVDSAAASGAVAGSGTYFLLKEKGASNVTLAASAGVAAASGATNVQTLLFTLPENHIINSGSSREYEVFSVGLPEDADTGTTAKVNMNFVDDVNYAPATTKAAAAGNTVWSDRSATGHSNTTNDWLNGFKLDIDINAIAVQ